MSSVKITSNVGEVFESIVGSLRTQVRNGMLKASEYAAGALRRQIKGEFKTRTGGLARSFKATIQQERKTGEISGGAFSDLGRAPVQNDGGVIKPKNRQYLAVPISQKAKRTVGLWPRHWAKGKLFLIKSKAGNLLLAEKSGRRGLVLHYALKRSVTIKGRHYIEAAASAVDQVVRDIMGESVKTAVEGGK
jgi:hypothetical protein